MSTVVKTPQYVIPKEILFADHFTDDSSRALGYARAVATRFGAHITVTHVSEPPNPIVTPDGSNFEALGYTGEDTEEQLLQRIEELRTAGVPADSLVRSGSVITELIEAAKEVSADLMVLGTHAPHGLDRLFFGSESERAADESGWPVMIIGPRVRPAPEGAWTLKRILCVLQPSVCSVTAAVFGVHLSQVMEAQTTFLIVEPENGEVADQAREFAYAVTEELSGVNVNLNPEIERVHVAEHMLLDDVLERAKNEEVGAIVLCGEVESIMHTHGHQTFLSKLLAIAPCPVIVTARGAANRDDS